jgi:hypothetical protein
MVKTNEYAECLDKMSFLKMPTRFLIGNLFFFQVLTIIIVSFGREIVPEIP